MLDLTPHRLELAIFQPQIAPNVGNIGRLCVASGTPLHVVRPMGFVLSDANLKRAGLDYWARLKLTIHDDTDAFLAALNGRSLYFFDSSGGQSLFDATFTADAVLCLGSETRGIDPGLLAANPSRVLRIPQAPGERCLNLSTSAGIVLYHALAQTQSTR